MYQYSNFNVEAEKGNNEISVDAIIRFSAITYNSVRLHTIQCDCISVSMRLYVVYIQCNYLPKSVISYQKVRVHTSV